MSQDEIEQLLNAINAPTDIETPRAENSMLREKTRKLEREIDDAHGAIRVFLRYIRDKGELFL